MPWPVCLQMATLGGGGDTAVQLYTPGPGANNGGQVDFSPGAALEAAKVALAGISHLDTIVIKGQDVSATGLADALKDLRSVKYLTMSFYLTFAADDADVVFPSLVRLYNGVFWADAKSLTFPALQSIDEKCGILGNGIDLTQKRLTAIRMPSLRYAQHLEIRAWAELVEVDFSSLVVTGGLQYGVKIGVNGALPKLETFKVSEDFVLARKEIKFSGVSKLTCAANAGLSKMLSECKSRSPDTWNSCTVSGAPGDC